MKILLAVDGSQYSQAAIQEVARHPWPPGIEVRVVTVDAPLGDSALATGWRHRMGTSAFDDLVREQRHEAKEQLEQSAASLRQLAPQLSISATLLEGTPKEEIVNEAERWGADLIVIGSQGKGAIKRLFLGSVSLAIVLSAPCSVLVVRERKDGSTNA